MGNDVNGYKYKCNIQIDSLMRWFLAVFVLGYREIGKLISFKWIIGLRISQFHGESIDPNQRTLGDFFIKPVCGIKMYYEDKDTTQKTDMEITNTNIDETICSTSHSLNTKNVLQPFDTPLSPASNMCVSANEIDEVANSSTFDFSDTMTSWKSSSEFETSSFLSSATWIDDYCSVCKLEIPSYFISERQEHMDFHVAEMLQQKYSSSDHSMERPKSFQKSKRLHR
mgnify:CR=1 FL=1